MTGDVNFDVCGGVVFRMGVEDSPGFGFDVESGDCRCFRRWRSGGPIKGGCLRLTGNSGGDFVGDGCSWWFEG